MDMTSEPKRVAPTDIIDVIRREFTDQLDRRDIDPTARLSADLGLDSMDMVRLMVALEDQFGIRFDPAAVDLDAVFANAETLADHIGRENRG